MAYNDTFLTIAFYVNCCVDVYIFVCFLKTFNLHFYRIRYFLVVIEQNFFTNNFAYKESSGFIGELIFVEIRRRSR